MASFSLAFMADNAAFDADCGRPEIARILRDLADRIEVGVIRSRVFDVNGNHVGSWVYDAAEPADETEE
jgi:hypothetical protein